MEMCLSQQRHNIPKSLALPRRYLIFPTEGLHSTGVVTYRQLKNSVFYVILKLNVEKLSPREQTRIIIYTYQPNKLFTNWSSDIDHLTFTRRIDRE